MFKLRNKSNELSFFELIVLSVADFQENDSLKKHRVFILNRRFWYLKKLTFRGGCAVSWSVRMWKTW